ncbi:PHP-associated domain-containing protein [Dehalogenimonas alkenigignens]|uniref:Putative metal-dependent phosphoesterases (PHP family) n=1 Tax=Dehalogenimonas alkenigignens TaxID=1217799 RepID=A0A0W0GIT1_9CHLR|nr:PHP domain-containing protein [Dehalogenimonas alkenigignens]KTB48486.1 putative metal-dependent phosphoesterases (PHP family) [Dehalogenimonas alkenigignens]PVV85064.1 PHP domain-containing protein [Dehalogenimonas alkenigignens]
MIKVDLHIHTRYSMDASTTIEELTARCNEVGLGAIAITDHGTTEGALEFKKLSPIPIIVGEEILTDRGEIIGLFLTETIPSGQSVEATIKSIRDQGGLVCIPHPFDSLRGSALDPRITDQLVESGQIDILEVLNARIVLPSFVNKARDFAARYGLAQSAGSDAHSPDELGKAYVLMQPFNNRDEFLSSLKNATIHGRCNSPLVHLNSTAQRIKRKFTG